MNLEEWFLKGIDAQSYVEAMTCHKEDLIYIYEHFHIDASDHPLFEQLQKRNLRAIIITEDWCGDAMLNIPVFLRFAEAGHIHTHFLLRDQNTELMDQYLTKDSRSIPKMIIINTQGEEVATWGPRAPEVQEFIDQSMEGLKNKETDDYESKQKEMLTFITKAYRNNQDFWNAVYNDLKKTLQY
ncbi:thioredoxin family protein [Halobacillus salinarum]|uniref:Thioredoxin family protein n=1 Tax=Halobacillus salinarum TaxID=2932257 RepID=A0ABY4ENP1_9BACI|nr:thioredoxin family protein [Halobacillus salinarum]UOQ46073.1 thioredoxin family protein [Halobacillus salinarum]